MHRDGAILAVKRLQVLYFVHTQYVICVFRSLSIVLHNVNMLQQHFPRMLSITYQQYFLFDSVYNNRLSSYNSSK